MTTDESETRILGVLGGIASGKSSVARLLAGEDGVVLDADRLAHEALCSDEVAQLVVEHFGEDALDANGVPDRAQLARAVFSAPELRKRLEGWIHPRVRARIAVGLEDARRTRVPRVVLDVPLLFENNAEHGLADLCEFLVFVEVADDVRDQRAVRDRDWKPGEVARREAAQLPLSEKKRRAQFIVRNEGTLDELRQAVTEVLERAGLS